MAKVQVIGAPQSNFVWAVRIALAEKGVEHDLLPVWSHSPEAKAAHPLGKIPGFRHGDRVLSESRAIIDYIDAAFKGARLVPDDVDGRLRSDVWTSIVTTSVEPLLIRRYLFAYLFPAGPEGAPDRAVIDGLLATVAETLDMLEAAFERGELGHDPFGRVDAYLVPILFYVRGLPEGGSLIEERSMLASYLDRGLQRASVRATLPPPPQP